MAGYPVLAGPLTLPAVAAVRRPSVAVRLPRLAVAGRPLLALVVAAAALAATGFNRLRALVRIRLIAGFGVAAESLTRQALDAFKQTELIHTHQ